MQRARTFSTWWNNNGIYSCQWKFIHTFITYAEDSAGYTSTLPTFPFFLSGPHCSGSEEHLIDCPQSEIEHITSCDHTSGVSCACTIISHEISLHKYTFPCICLCKNCETFVHFCAVISSFRYRALQWYWSCSPTSFLHWQQWQCW